MTKNETENEILDGLRVSTAEKLGYDHERFTAWQEAHINTVSMLRYVQDQQMAALASGEVVDPRDIALIGSQLQEALRPSFTTATGSNTRFGPDHRARLHALINKTLFADDVNEAERLAVMLREEAIQAQAAGVPVEAPVARPPEPPRADNVVPIDGAARANATKPPSHYLKDGQSDHVERSGYSMMAYRRDRWSPPYGF